MNLDERPCASYRIDASDVITGVDEAWLDFARSNGARHLTRAAVVNTSLWDHVAGLGTRDIYRHLFARVRAGRVVTCAFRCDSAAVRRLHEMRMEALGEGAIELQCRLLRQETRARPLSLIDPDTPRDETLVLMCSWCKRVQRNPTDWLELEEAIEALRLMSAPRLPDITHGICPSCVDTLKPRLTDDG